jgi:hypothetical protein
VSASGRLYVTFGSYFTVAPTGSGLDTYAGIDYVSMNPLTDTSWTIRVNGSSIGISETEIDDALRITGGPGPILPDAFEKDTPWFAAFAPSPSTVFSSLGLFHGDLAGSAVFWGGTGALGPTNLQIQSDPDAATVGGYSVWTQPIMFGGKLFIGYYNATTVGGAPGKVKIYVATSDTSFLSVDLNVLTSVSPAPPSTNVYPGIPYLYSGALYWPFYGIPGHTTEGFILKRTSGGTWSVVISNVANLTGASVVYSAPAA